MYFLVLRVTYVVGLNALERRLYLAAGVQGVVVYLNTLNPKLC